MSKLNCKLGDLARIVNSEADNNDKIVMCVEFMGVTPWRSRGDITYEPTWRVDRALCSSTGEWHDLISDNQLRPIRDNPGEDETMTWAGKPADVPSSPAEV